MATRKVKSFVSKKKDNKNQEPVEPIVFELEDQKFEAYGQVPGAVLLEFLSRSDGESSDISRAILYYLKESMDKENYKRFMALVHDPEILIDIETLSEIVGHLISERSAERPTVASEE